VAYLRVVNATAVQAAIDWGDGQTSGGTLRADGGPDFAVLGTTTYQHAGQFAVGVSVTGDGGLALTVTSEVIVSAGRTAFDIVVSAVPAVSATSGVPTASGGLTAHWEVGGAIPPPAPAEATGPVLPPPAPAAPPPAPPPAKPALPQGSSAATPRAITDAAGPRPVTPAQQASPRPVDPTTFVVWSSLRDQGGTVPQPAAALVLATGLTTVLDGSSAPARLDVGTYFVAQAGSDAPVPPPMKDEGGGGPGRATTAAGRREWFADEAVVAALADATRIPAATPPITPPASCEAAPGVAVEEEERGSREGPWERSRSLMRAAVLLVMTRVAFGLWGNTGWPGATRPRRDEAAGSPREGRGGRVTAPGS
jgi:hypothetical protein